MGGFISKISRELPLDHEFNESFDNFKNSFDKTPKYKMINDKMIDPRSATLEINRTPLCLLDVPDDDGNTPVTYKRKKSKKRSTLHRSNPEPFISEIHTKYCEFLSNSNSDLKKSSWKPDDYENNLIITNNDEEEKESVSSSITTDHNYESVVEELSECLNKVTMTPVYTDKDKPDKNVINKTPINKNFQKKFWTPDHLLNTKLPRERTPLGLLNSNLACPLSNSTSRYQGGKIWRGPSDERAVLYGENTPPVNLPPFNSPKSAPPVNRHLHLSMK